MKGKKGELIFTNSGKDVNQKIVDFFEEFIINEEFKDFSKDSFFDYGHLKSQENDLLYIKQMDIGEFSLSFEHQFFDDYTKGDIKVGLGFEILFHDEVIGKDKEYVLKRIEKILECIFQKLSLIGLFPKFNSF